MARRRRNDAEDTGDPATAVAEAPADGETPEAPQGDGVPQGDGRPDAVVERSAPAEATEDVKNRPVKTYSFPVAKGVFISGSVWPKVIEYDGQPLTVYSVHCEKSYWSDSEKAWKNTTYYRGSEVHVVLHALRCCEAFILDQRASDAIPF